MAGMAGGPCRGSDGIEPSQKVGTNLAHKRHIERVPQPVIGMPVEDHPVAERRLQLLREPLAERPYPVRRSEVASTLASSAKPDRQQGAFRARAPAALVARPVDQRLESNAAANIEGTDSLGGIGLVAGDGEQVDAKGPDIRGNLAERLRSGGVEEDRGGAGHPTFPRA